MRLNNYDISIINGYYILQDFVIAEESGKEYLAHKQTFHRRSTLVKELLGKGESEEEINKVADKAYSEYQIEESKSYFNEKARREREAAKRKEKNK